MGSVQRQRCQAVYLKLIIGGDMWNGRTPTIPLLTGLGYREYHMGICEAS